MPSIPTWYRAPITGIHATLRTTCRPGGGGPATPTPVPPMPIPLPSRSSPLGTSRTPSAPTMGSSVVIVMAEFCQVIGPLAPRSRPDDEDGQQDHDGEQPDGVPLHL